MAKNGFQPTEDAIKNAESIGKKLLSEVNRTNRTRTHISDIAAALTAEFGGATGYAKEYYATYLKVKESNSVTQQVALLKGVGNLIQIDTEINGRGTPTQDMPNEDINYELEELLQIGKEAIEERDKHPAMMSMEEIAKLQNREPPVDRQQFQESISPQEDEEPEDKTSHKSKIFEEDDEPI